MHVKFSMRGTPKWLKNPGSYHTEWMDFKTPWLGRLQTLQKVSKIQLNTGSEQRGHYSQYLIQVTACSSTPALVGVTKWIKHDAEGELRLFDHSIETLSYWTPPEWRLLKRKSRTRVPNEGNRQSQDTTGDAEIIHEHFEITLGRRDSYTDFIFTDLKGP